MVAQTSLLPGAAIARKADAVLHPDRRDDLLSGAVAAAGTGGGARRRRLGLAIHRAGAVERARCSAYLRPTVFNPMSANLQERSKQMEAELFGRLPAAACRTPADSGSTRSTATARPSSMPRAASSRARVLTGLTVFRFETDFQFKDRIEAREATLEQGAGGFKIGTAIYPRHAAGRSGQLLSADHPDAGPGPQQFLHPRNCVILATAGLYPLVRELRIRHRRLSAAIS